MQLLGLSFITLLWLNWHLKHISCWSTAQKGSAAGLSVASEHAVGVSHTQSTLESRAAFKDTVTVILGIMHVCLCPSQRPVLALASLFILMPAWCSSCVSCARCLLSPAVFPHLHLSVFLRVWCFCPRRSCDLYLRSERPLLCRQQFPGSQAACLIVNPAAPSISCWTSG